MKTITLLIAAIVTISMTGFAAAADGEHPLGYIAPPHLPGSEGITIGEMMEEETIDVSDTKEKDTSTRVSDDTSGFFSPLTTQEIANLYGQRYMDGDRSRSTMWTIKQLYEKYNVRPNLYIG